MVSLRSGKRTSRRSTETQQAETPKLKRSTRRAAVFEDEQDEGSLRIDVEEEVSSEIVEDLVEEIAEEEESAEVVEEEVEEIVEEPEAPAEEVDTQETVEDEEDDEVDEESDEDDEPMEITSKKAPSYDIKVAENPEPVASIYEQVMAKKAAKSAKDDEKRLKKRSKREARKVAKGVFRVKMEKSQASFKVVTLKRGVRQALEPANSFRDDLLKARTSTCRMQDSGLTVKRRDWVSK